MKQGQKVYRRYCAACHKADGRGLAMANFPALTGGVITTGPIDAHIQRVLSGKGAMASFAYLSDDDIAAVVTYERNALGNAVGDMAQPDDVAALRVQ